MEYEMKAKLLNLERKRCEEVIERRSASRYPCAGEVVLSSADEPILEIRGVLCDVSAEGFRATHHDLGLGAGQRVRFKHPFAEGTATVMWTQVLGKKAQSGFLVSEGKE
jgi:hypothetical protein